MLVYRRVCTYTIHHAPFVPFPLALQVEVRSSDPWHEVWVLSLVILLMEEIRLTLVDSLSMFIPLFAGLLVQFFFSIKGMIVHFFEM